MKKSSILVGALALGAITMGTAPSFASLRTTGANGIAVTDAKCGDKKTESNKTKDAKCGDKKSDVNKAKAKEGKCGEGKCGEGKCGGKENKKHQKKEAKKPVKDTKKSNN